MLDIKDLRLIKRNLGRFLKRFEKCIKTAPSRRHLSTYIGGQIGNLERKSIEPIALEAGVPPRTLQEFLSNHRWNEEALSRRQREILMRDHADPNAIAVIDETSFAKKGNKTPCVQRQYCGSTGKTDNCVVSVHLAYASADMQALVDEDVFLPENTWGDNLERRRQAGIPDEMEHRTKWQIALELLERSIGEGMEFRFLTADEAYGRCSIFRHRVSELGLTYVVEVPRSTHIWLKKPKVMEPVTNGDVGKPQTSLHLMPSASDSRRVDDILKNNKNPWIAYHIKDTGKGPVVWEVKAKRVWASEKTFPSAEPVWLLMARNVLDGEVKYFLSNACQDTSVETMLKVAFTRWVVERLFEDAKGEVGLDHFEVRTYKSLKRHLILSRVSLHFLQREANKQRKKKFLVESVPDSDGRGSPDRTRHHAA